MEQEKIFSNGDVTITVNQTNICATIVIQGITCDKVMHYEIKSSVDGKTELVFNIDLPFTKLVKEATVLRWRQNDL